MKIIYRSLLLFLGFSITSCFPPAPSPLEPESAAIGVTAMEKGTFANFPFSVVGFVRLENTEEINSQIRIYFTNFSKKDNLYLLNIPPGRYAAVMAGYQIKSIMFGKRTIVIHRVFFSEVLAKKTIVNAAPGTIAFAGILVVDVKLDLKKADPVQKHYMELMEGKFETDTGSRFLKEGVSTFIQASTGLATPKMNVILLGYLIENRRDAKTEKAFLQEAMSDLNNEDWSGHVKRSLSRLQ